MSDKRINRTIEGFSRAGFTGPEEALRALEVLEKTGIGGEAGAEENVKNIGHILDLALLAPSPDEALQGLVTLIEIEGVASLSELKKDGRSLKDLVFLLGASPFLSRLLLSGRGFFQRLFFVGELQQKKTREQFLLELRTVLKAGGAEGDGEGEGASDIKKIFRLYRLGEFLRLGARDLLGLAEMEETTCELSELAGAALEAAIEISRSELEELYGPPVPAAEAEANKEECPPGGFAVIGLGKLGAYELNYSSDIDIMYVYEDGERWQGRKDITPGEFYTKLAVKVTKLLGEVTTDGLVFRVDLDLRPGGRSGAIIQSVTGAELYYEAQGREWERAAMIKARCVAGDAATGQSFLKMIEPFVYRRNLGFTAIEEIKTMKENIDLAAKKQGKSVEETNVKLGRGGIREIEFFTQALQLIYGGRDRELRLRGTLQALRVLVSRGLVSSGDEARLGRAYVFLRNLEHRLQIIECQQTHTLTHGGQQEQRVARMMGFSTAPPFTEELKRITGSVNEVFRELFYSASSAGEVDNKVLALFSPHTDEKERENLLLAMGFKDAKTALGNLELLRKGPPGLRRTSARGREIFERAAPFLLSKILLAPDPDLALNHLEKFISNAGASSTQYALLVENPTVAEKLINIFGTSEFLSKGITDRPENLDLLLSRDLSRPLKAKEDFFKEFSDEVLTEDRGLEEALDGMRRIRNSEVMRIGLNHLSGAITPGEVSAQMTDMAEAALHTAWQVGVRELQKTYTPQEKAVFAIIGLGSLGARELGFGSDLDIVFVYEAAAPGDGEKNNSQTEKNITEHEFFAKLCQRIITALTVKTREGSVFDVDTRLRPSGSSGPLVVSRHAFIKYHGGSTALWERQAFIRARYVAGDEGLGRGAVAEVQELIYSHPLTEADIKTMLDIRKRMEVEIARESRERYNFKTGRGGIVDIEFLVQALQLRWGGTETELREPGTTAALRALVKKGYLEEGDYDFLQRAYGFFRRIDMAQRIKHNRSETYLSRDKEKVAPLARALGYNKDDARDEGGEGSEGKKLLEDYGAAAAGVREIYERTLAGLT